MPSGRCETSSIARSDGLPLEHRSVEAMPSYRGARHRRPRRPGGWFFGVITEVRDAVRVQGLVPTGPPGGLYGFDVYANDRGPLPCSFRRWWRIHRARS